MTGVDPAGRQRSRLVLVTGEPGSGKGSLGRALGAALHLPFLSRDDVRMGLFATAGLWANEVRAPVEREVAVDTFLRVVEAMAGLGVSAVLEIIVFRDRPQTLERLREAADCVVVHTTCTEASARADRRDRSDPFFHRREVLDALGHESVDDFVDATASQREVVREGMRTALDLPVLSVRTDDGYDPPLDEIVDWIVDQGRR